MRGNILIKFLKTIELLSKPVGTTTNKLKDELGVDKSSVYREYEDKLITGCNQLIFRDLTF